MSSNPQQSESLAIKYDLIELRRDKLLEYNSKGLNYTEIAKLLGVDKSTITRDMQELKKQAKERLKEYVEETLPVEFEKSRVVFQSIKKQVWAIALRQDIDVKTELEAYKTLAYIEGELRKVLGEPEYVMRAIKAVAEIKKSLKPVEKSPVKQTPEPAQPPVAQDDDDPVIGIEITEDPPGA